MIRVTFRVPRQELCLSPKKQEYRRVSWLDFRAETEFTTDLQLVSLVSRGIQCSMRSE